MTFNLYAQKHITTDNGLSSKNTFSIVKDNNEFIWISTRDGVDKYDGNNIQHYKLLDDFGKINLAGRVNKLKKSPNGNIWALSAYGQFFCFDETKDQYTQVIDLTKIIKKNDIYLYDITFATPDHIFVYGSFGLWLYDLKNKTISEIDYFKNDFLLTVIQIAPNQYAIGTRTGLYIYTHSGILSEGKTIRTGLNNRVQTIYFEEKDNTLLVGTHEGELFLYDINKNVLSSSILNLGVSIRTILPYKNSIYVATNGDGIYCLNRTNLKIQEKHTDFNLERHNNIKFINSILIEEERLWISTYSDGVFLYDNGLPSFRFLPIKRGEKDKSNAVTSLLEDNVGDLWATSIGGIYRYNKAINQWRSILTNTDGYDYLTLCTDDNGKIWAGGSTKEAIICINPQTEKIEQKINFLSNPLNTNTKRVYCIYKGSGNTIWFGGIDCNLAKYDISTNEHKEYNLMFVNTIIEHNKQLYIGTTHGLYLYNKSTDSFEKNKVVENTVSFTRKHINCIYVDDKETVWLGTEGGLLKYDNNQLKIYEQQDKSIYSIYPDFRGRLWISTKGGLICLDPVTENTTRYEIENRLSDDIFKLRAVINNSIGELIFGTTDGIMYFTPEYVDKTKVGNKLYFTKFGISYQTVYPNEKGSPLSTVIEKTNKIELKHNQNTFSIGFVNINYTNPLDVDIEWKLEGYDKDWISQSGVTEAYYTNVPHGNYTFLIRLKDKNNSEIISTRSIQIQILAPFWMTKAALFIYFLLILGIVWVIFQLMKNRLEKWQTLKKIHFFVNTSHELKTPITLIKGPLVELKESSNLSEDDRLLLELATNNVENLNRLVNQLLDLQKNESSTFKLLLSECDIVEHINNKIDTFSQAAQQKKVTIEKDIPMSTSKVWIDLDKIDKIINNLMSNALKYTLPNGNITVKFREEGELWSLEISDNGIGIPEKEKKNIFKPFFRAENTQNIPETGTGIGLLLTKSLVAKLGGELQFNSVEAKGSTFKILLKRGYQHLDKNKYVLEKSSKIEDEDNQANTNIDSMKSTILIVEDNRELRNLLRQILKGKYNIYTAENGIDALIRVKEINPELILSDIMMPYMDGYDLCDRIKSDKETSHIPVILLSVLEDKKDILKGYKYGADNYVTKPFDADILKLTIENTITTRQSLRKNLILPLEQNLEEEFVTNPLDKAFIDEVISVIDKNISNIDFSIDDLCSEIAMGRSSFYKKMKILTNEPPNNFVRLVRLNRAAKLLRDKQFTVSEISYAVGISDAKYFSTIFKKQYGVSPSIYADQNES